MSAILEQNDHVSPLECRGDRLLAVVLPEQGNYSALRKLLNAAETHAALVSLDPDEDEDVREEFATITTKLYWVLRSIS
jgi:hypothetical protein